MDIEMIWKTYPAVTDIHATEDAPFLIRLSGNLAPLEDVADHAFFETLFSRYVPEGKRRSFMEKGSCDTSFSLGNKRIRCHLYKAGGKWAAALRVLPELSTLPADPDMNFLTKLCDRTHGLILVTGTSGSGKSTTLARLLSILDERKAYHIVTLEDPIEYEIPSRRSLVHQRELSRDVESFASGIRDALREDPDVICVGELRDSDTMDAALMAAETGHLVLATLHTTRAKDAVSRLIHAFPAAREQEIRSLLAENLYCVLSQMLYRNGKDTKLIREILVTLPAVAHLIREGKEEQIPSYMEMGLSGMRTMKQAVYGLKVSDRERDRILKTLA